MWQVLTHNSKHLISASMIIIIIPAFTIGRRGKGRGWGIVRHGLFVGAASLSKQQQPLPARKGEGTGHWGGVVAEDTFDLQPGICIPPLGLLGTECYLLTVRMLLSWLSSSNS